MNRLFLVVEYLLLYFLKTEMRKQVTPQLVKITIAPSGSAILAYASGFIEEVQQYIVKTIKGELGLVEVDSRTNEVRQAYFVKLAAQSQRLSFGLYRQDSDNAQMATELDSLIENVLSNLRNEPLVRKLSHTFDSSLVNHIKGDKKVKVDSYDEDLMEAEFETGDIVVEGKATAKRASQQPGLDSSRSKVQSPASMEHPVKEPAAKTEPEVEWEKPVVLQSEDNTAAVQQRTEELSRMVEVVHPEENAANFGLRKQSVRPEVYAAYEKKLTELLNNVYLDDKTWNLVEDKDGLKFWSQDHSHYVIQRSEIDIPYPLETVKNYICDPSFRYKYDTMLKSFEIVETLTDQVAIIRVVMKGSFPVSDRDFVTCRMMFYQNKDVGSADQTFIYMNFTPEFVTIPEQKGCVRAELALQGVILTRVSEHRTRYTVYSKSDPKIKGVPQMIIRKKAHVSGTMPLAFKEKVDEFEKNKRKQ